MNELIALKFSPWFWFGPHLREIQIRLAGKNERFRFDASHGFFEVAVVGILEGAVAALPGLQHGEHVLWVWIWRRREIYISFGLRTP